MLTCCIIARGRILRADRTRRILMGDGRRWKRGRVRTRTTAAITPLTCTQLAGIPLIFARDVLDGQSNMFAHEHSHSFLRGNSRP